MQILQTILIITPGIIATYIYEHRKKCNFTFRTWLYYVTKYVLIIFWLINMLQYLRGWSDFDWTGFSVQFIVKYILLTLLLAIVLPHINLYFDSKSHNS